MASLCSLLLSSSLILAVAVFLRHHIGASTTTTHLHFYMHDAYTGPAPTAMRVVSSHLLLNDGDANINDATSPPPSSSLPRRQFGDIVVLNSVLTEGPSTGSVRGHGAGFRGAGRHGVGREPARGAVVLEAGEHRGSSVTAKGRIDMDAGDRESVVIGATGRFRLARGYMVTKNYDYSLATGGVVVIDVYLRH
uniref:Dirigent protein n=1 Tax=Oryza glumipatula TaxID=40148 RepID=A0A0E0BIE2_9ORYZ